jgi:hypothetical protein
MDKKERKAAEFEGGDGFDLQPGERKGAEYILASKTAYTVEESGWVKRVKSGFILLELPCGRCQIGSSFIQWYPDKYNLLDTGQHQGLSMRLYTNKLSSILTTTRNHHPSVIPF